MGQALEWLGRDGCRSVFAELVAVDGRRSTESRLWACCPFHQERTPSFKYEPEKDRFHCFGCKQSGDLIDLYEHLNGYAPGDGFMPFRDRYAPDGKLDPRRDKPAAKRPAGPPPWTPSEVRDVAPQWSERAESFVAHSQERLAANAEALAWLAGRGITPETAQVCPPGLERQGQIPAPLPLGAPRGSQAQRQGAADLAAGGFGHPLGPRRPGGEDQDTPPSPGPGAGAPARPQVLRHPGQRRLFQRLRPAGSARGRGGGVGTGRRAALAGSAASSAR